MFSPVKLTRAEAAAGNALCHLAAVAARTFGTEVTFSSAAASEEMVELTLALNGVETPMFVSPEIGRAHV